MRVTFGHYVYLPLLLIFSQRIQAQTTATPAEPDRVGLTFGAFVDTYYSTSAYRPQTRDRQFLTQVARDREFNINLAHIEAVIDDTQVRGRLALQFGTSVNANYQNEPTGEKYSNQISTRNLQEAYAGYRLLPRLWLDMGIFYGHIGFENWVSHNNWNYTRALNLDNVPYYATGARLSYDATEKLKLQLHVLNGWQVITSTNRDKSLGTQIAYELHTKFRIVHNSFAGNVAPDDSTTQYRFYSNLILEFVPFEKLAFALSSDVGTQKNPHDNGYRNWYTGAIYMRWLMTQNFSGAIRLEYFLDRDQVMINTGTQNGFRVAGITTNFDYRYAEIYRLRFEYRNFFSQDSIYLFSDAARPQEHIFSFAASIKVTSRSI